MEMTRKISCVGFLLAVSTITASMKVNATPSLPHLSIESRLSRLTEAMQQSGIEASHPLAEDNFLLGIGWADGNHRGWVNTNRGGFANHQGGGGFANRNWGDGGRFYNHHGGGGFLNR